MIRRAEKVFTGYPLMGADGASGVFLNVSGLDLKERAGTKAKEADAKACEEKYNGQNGSMDYRPPGLLAKEARGEISHAAPADAPDAHAADAAGNPNLL